MYEYIKYQWKHQEEEPDETSVFIWVLVSSSSNSVWDLDRDASIRYSGSVSAPIRSFSADRVSERRDRSKSDIVCILFCVIVKPHESTKAL